MSKEKNVWASLLSYANVNIYGIGMRIPDVYDFPTLRKLQAKMTERQELVDYVYDEEVEALLEKCKAVGGEYGETIEDISHNFQRFPNLPDSLWSQDKRALPKTSEYLFRIKGGGAVVNESVANVLKQFRLGESTLTPLQIHRVSTGKLWLDETFYFLNLWEHRHFIIYPQSHDEMEYSSGLKAYHAPDTTRDNLLELQSSATDCDLDLWHDPLLRKSYFMSDALHDALVEAEVDAKWGMMRCRLA